MIPVNTFQKDKTIYSRRDESLAPLVSVVMPTYRLRDGMTERAIHSVLGQTMSDLELLLIDDGSNDGLQDLLLSVWRDDPRVTVVRHELNSGLPAIRANEGMVLASGRYIAYQFEDDLWNPDMLSSLLSYMPVGERHFVYGVAAMVHAEKLDEPSVLLGNTPFDYSKLKETNIIANNAVLHPRSVLDQIGLYDPHLLLRRCCDYDLWLRMSRVLTPVWCPEVVSRVHYAHRHAIGSTMRLDQLMARLYMSLDRSRSLLPEKFGDIDICDGRIFADQQERDWFQRTYVAPYVAQYPYFFTRSERLRHSLSRRRQNRMLVTKGAYSTSIDVTIGNFAEALDAPFNRHAYVPEGVISSLAQADMFDTLVCYRTTSPSITRMVSQDDRPYASIYLMDDDMLRMHELGRRFADLAPGTVGHESVREQIRVADSVITYSRSAAETARALNPRVFRLETNILTKYVASSAATTLQPGERLKFAILTSTARDRELAEIWPEIVDFASVHSQSVEFHFWGFDSDKLAPLAAPVFVQNFTNTYSEYVRRLDEEGFHFVLSPLADSFAANRGKSPVKYLEAVAAGAVIIASDVEPYAAVRNRWTGIKVDAQPGAWRNALEQAATMSEQEREAMFARAKRDVSERFTTESQTLDYCLAYAAGTLHADLRSRTAVHGKARIAYYVREHLLGGATLHILQHAQLLARMQFQPVICVPPDTPEDSEFLARVREQGFEWHRLAYNTSLAPDPSLRCDLAEVRRFLIQEAIRLVHGTSYSAEWSTACHNLGIPLVMSLHQCYIKESSVSNFLPDAVHCSSFRYAEIWRHLLKVTVYTMPVPVEEDYFTIFSTRPPRQPDGPWIILVSGTVQPRKGQLAAIHAVSELVRQGHDIRLVIAGYTEFFPDYVSQCHAAIADQGLADRVEMVGFVKDVYRLYRTVDVVLCSSDDESQPQALVKAMAAGLPVVATPVGGVGELIRDGYSGVISQGFDGPALADALRRLFDATPERIAAMVEHAHLTVRSLCDEKIVTLRLLELYGTAIAVRKERSRRTLQDESRMISVEIQRTAGTIYLYSAYADSQKLDWPENLPKGWETRVHPTLGQYVFSSESTPLVLSTPCRQRFSLRVLAHGAPGEKSTAQVASGALRTSIDGWSDKPGGEFRTYDFDIRNFLTDTSVAALPQTEPTVRLWTATDEDLPNAKQDWAGEWGAFDCVVAAPTGAYLVGWSLFAEQILIVADGRKVVLQGRTEDDRPDLVTHFGSRYARALGWRLSAFGLQLVTGWHLLEAYRKPYQPSPLTRLPGAHLVHVGANGSLANFTTAVADLTSLDAFTLTEPLSGNSGQWESMEMREGGQVEAEGWAYPDCESHVFRAVMMVDPANRIIGWGALSAPRGDLAQQWQAPRGWKITSVSPSDCALDALRLFIVDLDHMVAAQLTRPASQIASWTVADLAGKAFVAVGPDQMPYGFVERSEIKDGWLTASGWARTFIDNHPIDGVLVINSSNQMLAFAPLAVARPDIATALGNRLFLNSGWTVRCNVSDQPQLRFFAVTVASLKVFPLNTGSE